VVWLFGLLDGETKEDRGDMEVELWVGVGVAVASEVCVGVGFMVGEGVKLGEGGGDRVGLVVGGDVGEGAAIGVAEGEGVIAGSAKLTATEEEAPVIVIDPFENSTRWSFARHQCKPQRAD
jgi:hypothetical protein